MVRIIEAVSARQKREFLRFPLRMYKDNPCFVPPLYADEKKIFRSDYVYNDCCESVYYLAVDENGKTVGRISGIIQKAANEKNSEKRVRFTRFDSIDDPEVAAALFGAVENWALSHGMDTVCGPLGFSDLEREGLLIDGFDQLSTFEEQYNAPYYQTLIENLGYKKEVDWFESQLRLPAPEQIADMERTAKKVQERFGLHFGTAKNIKDFVDRYADDIFRLIDVCYDGLYGTVPFTDGMKKMTVDNFKLLLDLRFVSVIFDSNDRMVCFGVCMPAIGEAVRRSGGRLTPGTLIRVLRAVKKPKVIDLALIGVDPEYANRGIAVMLISSFLGIMRDTGVEYAETNLNLEDNHAIRNMWRRFDSKEHKKRRSYVKKLTERETAPDDKDNS